MLKRSYHQFNLSLRPQQRLIIKTEMKKALYALQLPISELSRWVEQEILNNPILECDHQTSYDSSQKTTQPALEEVDFVKTYERKKKLYNNYFSDHEKIDRLHASLSSYEQLVMQARECFEEQQLFIAKLILANLNTKGYFSHSPELFCRYFNINKKKFQQILKTIQTFDPLGIGTKNMQDFFLLQMKQKFPQERLYIKIIKNDFPHLLHGHWRYICKKYRVKISFLKEKNKKLLSHLHLHPLKAPPPPIQTILPDIFLIKKGHKWLIKINDVSLPPIHICDKYLHLFYSKKPEEKRFVLKYYQQSLWLKKILGKRKTTLTRIALSVYKKQKGFFNHYSNLVSMSVKDIAQELSLHDTTIRRAIQNKYISTPFGIFPLKYFFSSFLSSTKPTISKQTAKDLLKKLIQEEDKSFPLSDASISTKLKQMGIICSRRTVAKYRQKLLIGSAHQRKQLH